MNLKKGLLQTVAIGAVLLGALSMGSNVEATAGSKLMKMQIPTYRTSGYAYRAGLVSSSATTELEIWKILEYNSNGATAKNTNNGIYCLKMGVGFGSEGGSATQDRTYNQYADMKAPGTDQAMITAYKNSLPSVNNYNAIVWILDHAYVPAPSSNPTAEQTENARVARAALLEAAGIPSSKISDDLIDIVQQIAIWYFSNNDKYKANSISGFEAKTQNTSFENIEDLFADGWDMSDDAKTLYNYFITNGTANLNTTPVSSNTNPITLNSNSAITKKEGNYYISGPYTITQLSDINYTLTGALTSSSGSNISYTLLDSNKAVTSKILKQLVGENFYIRTAATEAIEGAKFKITSSVKQNNITYWTVSNNITSEQPVAIIEPQTKTFEAETTITLSEFDLALRKFITKIGTTEVETREPVITAEEKAKLYSGATKTVEKTHRKDALEVRTGDTVLYTIRIYNEGTLNGYATEITDYLPAGLTLKAGSTINTENGWTNPSGDGKTIVTTKLADTLLEKFNGTDVKYADLQIECTVTALISENDQSLKNVAEITGHADENKNAITDRDSTPKNLTNSQKNNYNPGTSTRGWGYEDDDDYEELVMRGKYFDLALRKFITKINNQNLDIDRTPVVTPSTISGSKTTATKEHTKTALRINTGDTVLYTIRIYNEGELDGYATEITDYLPAGLKLKDGSTINTENGWTNPSGDGKTIVSTKLENTLLHKFNGTTIESADLQVECEVIATVTAQNQSLKNVAEITEAKDENKNTIKDRDSTPKNLSEDQKNDYKPTPFPTRSEQGEGYEDDDDFEELILPGRYFDLALRKFITKVNGEMVETDRTPEITEADIAELNSGRTQTSTKSHTKDPVRVNVGDTVLYTIRVYNEGELDGYASEVTDYLPAGLKLKAGSSINTENGWTNPSGDGKTIVSTKLADKLLNKFDGTKLSCADLQVECEVVASASQENQSLKNIAEITKALDENKEEITDRDSQPGNVNSNPETYNPQNPTKGMGEQDDDDYEELLIPGKEFDLALRKFITNINGKELVNSDGTYTREPSIDLSKLKDGSSTTATYKHPKNPIGVAIGDIVIYTLRIYNEGELDGYANSVTDYLPPQLQFVMDDEENFNAKYGWEIDKSLRKATTTHLSKELDAEDNLIKAFDGEELDYKELKIKCKVVSTENLEEVITNIAEITNFVDANGNTVTDRDSQKENVVLPADSDLPDYKGNESNKSILTDSDYFYKGQQDDDDFEKLILEQFDLALRKFITKVNETEVTNRVPKFTNVKDSNGNYIYEHTKEPIEVESTDIVEYTLRIYNEGDIAGYAKEIKDDIPSGLEFLPENETNKEYRWIMIDKDGKETKDAEKAVAITTDYLSKEQEKEEGSNLIEAFDETKTSPDYKEVKVAFKVIALNTYDGIITNIAQISDDSDESGNPVEDKDSTPNNDEPKEDDQDVEHIKLKYFDLALRKFITGVDETEVTSRVPKFTITEDGKYVYEHTKEPVEVENGNIVTYTLRIYNEGTKAGYAEEIKDDVPEGLEFLPDNDTNKEYRWVMLDENGEETEDVSKAEAIATDYLSKAQGEAAERDNLLKAFDKETMDEPDYRDIKIAFKVTEPNTSDRILINKAQISNDADKDGKPVVDIDSTPDKWNEGEDDQDIEKVKVKYFDLALRKWVTQAIVIDNGKQTVTETGHKAEDDPEKPVKVEVKESRLNKVVIKFRYKIRITNEGEIAGYATEISDYIPQGLKFVAADNPKWKEVEGKVVTDQLKDTLLEPGETAEVEILLTWINGKNNFGLKTNIAEISKDKNESNTPDIDSTPNNKVPQEDDQDDAPVILTIKTGAGEHIEYIILAIGALAILSSGVILIKKYVL